MELTRSAYPILAPIPSSEKVQYPMKASPNAVSLIKRFEGFEPEAYLCPAGVWTIGYGQTGGVKKDDRVTLQEAEQLLSDVLETFSAEVCQLLRVEVTQSQFDALVSFAYNVGLGALKDSTLLRKLNEGDKTGAAEEFERWNRGGGKVLAGLTRRRAAEKELFLS